MIPLHVSLWGKDPRERAETYKALFTGALGERVLEDLKRQMHFYRPTFDPNPGVAAFKEGQRSVIVAITNTIAAVEQPAPAADEDPDA